MENIVTKPRDMAKLKEALEEFNNAVLNIYVHMGKMAHITGAMGDLYGKTAIALAKSFKAGKNFVDLPGK